MMTSSAAQQGRGDEPILRVESLTKRYGDHRVFEDLSLEVRQGEVVAIVGPSGTGKSTLLRCVNRLEQVDGGRVWFEGEEVPARGRDLHLVRSRMGMVFQDFNLFPHLTVERNLTVAPMLIKKRSKSQATRTAQELLERVGMSDKLAALPAALSGGQKQRVAIARALAMEPSLIMFDEATSALDPELVREVLDVMKQLALDGMTMLVVTHEMTFAREACSRIIFMSDGRIVEDAAPADFLDNPQTERAKRFLNQIDA